MRRSCPNPPPAVAAWPLKTNSEIIPPFEVVGPASSSDDRDVVSAPDTSCSWFSCRSSPKTTAVVASMIFTLLEEFEQRHTHTTQSTGGSRANAISRARKFVVKHAEARFRALQTSECNELLDPARASCMILAQRQPGKNVKWCCRHEAVPSQRSKDVAVR